MGKPLIDENLEKVLHEQWAHEVFNAHAYLYICGYLRNKGFENIAKHFMGQYEEELSHSRKIFDLLTDLNTDVILPSINICDMQFNSIVDVAKLYLDREILTTESLNEIKDLAIQFPNSIVEEFMREMIGLQKHELSEASTFMDKCEILGNNWVSVLLWDASLK